MNTPRMNAKILSRLLVLGVMIGLAATLAAQSASDGPRGPRAGRGEGGPGGRGGHPVIRTLDADRDHMISAQEIANAPAALRALDTNHDGTVAADELRPARPANAPTPPADAPARSGRPGRDGGGERPRPVDPVMLALDANNDGTLSADEISRAATSLVALDLNKDGQLTPDEFRPLPPANRTP